jgi:hypothetical protein
MSMGLFISSLVYCIDNALTTTYAGCYILITIYQILSDVLQFIVGVYDSIMFFVRFESLENQVRGLSR